MTKLDRLNSFMTERLMAAVKEILFTVGKTVREYEEETERVRSENQRLKEMLRDTGCFSMDTSAATLESYQSISPIHPGWICSQNEDPETIEEIPGDPSERHDELHPLIKSEKPRYSINAKRESPPKANESSDVFVENNDTIPVEDSHFAPKIKVEYINSNSSSGDEMQSAEDVYQDWSPQCPDLPQGISDVYRTQHPTQQTYTNADIPPLAFQHCSSSLEDNHVSYHNILCSNRTNCSSKCCEMQKRTVAKSSPVWKYFSLKEGDCSKAVCLMCMAVISRGRKEYTTSALLKHLRMKHGHVLIFASSTKTRVKEILTKTL